MHTSPSSLLARLAFGVAAAVVFVSPFAARAADAEPVRGPFWSGTIMKPGRNAEALANKALAVYVGADKKSYLVYDLDTLRLAGAWSGDFVNWGNTLSVIQWPPPPSVRGNVVLGTDNGPGWADAKGSFADGRDHKQGPLPKNWAHYKGSYVHDGKAVLKYSVGDAEVLEFPSAMEADGRTVFSRTLQFTKAARNVRILVASSKGAATKLNVPGDALTVTDAAGASISLKVEGASKLIWDTDNGQVTLKLDQVAKNAVIRISLVSGDAAALAKPGPVTKDLLPWTKGGSTQWAQTVTTQGKLGTEEGPYQVDTITEPFENPYGAKLYWGGFDFLPDGRAVICAYHGDVWIVSGIDAKMDKLVWKRFATGLFQPLGVKVQKGEIYVAGRDQITRLKDLNRDGEADFYENFNNDTVVTPNYHEFVLDLHTDTRGNFYFAKGSPWEPLVTSPSQGSMFKVSADGSKMEVVATGLRAPNGMTVGPKDQILVGDNQGHWMPSSKVSLVKPGGFYGMVPAAQRELTLKYADGREIKANPSSPEARAEHKLKGWDAAMPIPTSYDQPVAWVPMRWDNSSGGQVYVTSTKWGPWNGSPLVMSYGKCLLYGMMMDNVDGVDQATLVPFGLKFASGIMRGRFNEKDGQLYLAGLKGWQNAASREGGFYRVRHTGKPANTPVKTHVAANGIEITFSDPLDAKSATDAANYGVELWNYRYSGAYGSPEISVKTPGKNGHDTLEVKGAKLSSNRKTLFLEVAGLEPANQFSVKYSIATADGAAIKSEVIGTIHKLGKAMK